MDRRRFFAAADAITLLEMYARDDRCILDKFSSAVRPQRMLTGIIRSHDWHQVHDAQTFQGSDSKQKYIGLTLEALLLVLRKYGVHDSLLDTIAECADASSAADDSGGSTTPVHDAASSAADGGGSSTAAAHDTRLAAVRPSPRTKRRREQRRRSAQRREASEIVRVASMVRARSAVSATRSTMVATR